MKGLGLQEDLPIEGRLRLMYSVGGSGPMIRVVEQRNLRFHTRYHASNSLYSSCTRSPNPTDVRHCTSMNPSIGNSLGWLPGSLWSLPLYPILLASLESGRLPAQTSIPAWLQKDWQVRNEQSSSLRPGLRIHIHISIAIAVLPVEYNCSLNISTAAMFYLYGDNTTVLSRSFGSPYTLWTWQQICRRGRAVQKYIKVEVEDLDAGNGRWWQGQIMNGSLSSKDLQSPQTAAPPLDTCTFEIEKEQAEWNGESSSLYNSMFLLRGSLTWILSELMYRWVFKN